MMKNFTATFSLLAAFSTTLLSLIIAIFTGGIHAASVTPKCDVVSVNSPWKRLSNGLELMFGNSKQDFNRAQRLCKAHNATLPLESMVDSIRPCLRNSSDYYWLQTCSLEHVGRVFNVTDSRNANEDSYYNYVCVITTDIKTVLTIQVEDQSNTTYNNKGTKNIFQAWSGQTLNLFCQSALPNMLPRLCVKNGNNSEASNNSNTMTWTPENCEDDITVTCESRHCPNDLEAAVQTDVSIKVKCPLEIVSFTSNSKQDKEGIHIYKIGEDATYTCLTKGSSDVTIVKTQGMAKRGTVVSRNHTYSVTGLSCEDMGTYYCIAKQDGLQVNRSINIAVNGSCPPRLYPEETQGEGSPDVSLTLGQEVTVCVMAYPVLFDHVSFNGQNVLCGGGISSSPWQCSIKKSQHFMTYNFTFVIHNVSLTDNKKITIGLKTSEQGGVLNLTYSLIKDGGRYLINTTPVPPPVTTTITTSGTTSGAAVISLPVIIGIAFIALVLLIAVIMLSVLYCKMREKRHRNYRPYSLMYYHNGHSNRNSKTTDDDVELYSNVNVGSPLGSPNPIQGQGDSQESEDSRYTPWMPMDRARRIPVEIEPRLPVERASGIPLEREPMIPLERAPGIPLERKQRIPMERASGIPLESEPMIPLERTQRSPLERAPRILLEREPRLLVKRASEIPLEREPMIPLERAPGIPLERKQRIPVERAPGIPFERKLQIPGERAPRIPLERKLQIPVESAPGIPVERESRIPVEREPNENLYQNLSEAMCSSTDELYVNLRTLRNMPSPSDRPVSQPATNGTLKSHRQNGYHPISSVSSNTTSGSYISQEGLHYVTVAHSQSSGSKHSSLNRQRDSRERDSVQYASLDFENSGKYDARKDKRKLKRLKSLKHKRHS